MEAAVSARAPCLQSHVPLILQTLIISSYLGKHFPSSLYFLLINPLVRLLYIHDRVRFLFKIFKIYLGVERASDSSHKHFHPLGHSPSPQEPRTQSLFPTWVAETLLQVLSDAASQGVREQEARTRSDAGT